MSKRRSVSIIYSSRHSKNLSQKSALLLAVAISSASGVDRRDHRYKVDPATLNGPAIEPAPTNP